MQRNDFSAIACRLILGKDTFGATSSPQQTSNHPIDRVITGNTTHAQEASPAPRPETTSRDLGVLLRELTLDMFNPHVPMEDAIDAPQHPVLDDRCRAIITNVKAFFEEFRRRLGKESRGTIFDAPSQLTALACGVCANTVSKLKTEATYVRKPIPRAAPTTQKNRTYRRAEALRMHGGEWGAPTRHLIHEKFKEEENVTVAELWNDMKERYPSFALSETSFYYLLRGLGFTYRLNNGQRYIFERPELVNLRSKYLSAVDRAREEAHCLVYMDETWVYDCMTRKRGWADTTIPRFAPASVLEEYSCGKTATKNKGRRAIVIGAMTDEGVVPGCTRVILSGRGLIDEDYHRDMNNEVFEDWLRSTLPHMLEVAGSRRLSLIMDNAPYHSRQLEKIPGPSSTKAVIENYLRSHGVTVEANSSKETLLAELREFIGSHGGRSALRRYAVESICADFGVTVIRLPPYHCFFNPIELCWSQLKGNLAKSGKPGDSLETVRTRTLDWMRRVPVDLCRAWVNHVKKEEIAAKEKIRIDRINYAAMREGLLDAPASDDSGSDISDLESEVF